jgi:hypothetical protein
MSLVMVIPVLLGFAAPASAIDARPFVFIGAANECGAGYPAGARIVTAGWLRGMGLPDNGGSSNPIAGDPRDLENKTNVRDGLFLSKNGPTPVCAASGARIGNLGAPITVDLTTTFSFDYRTAFHCGAGAPRFNITYDLAPGFSFAGCASAVKTPSPLDAGWTHAEINLQTAFPPVPVGAQISEVSIIFDEGTDAGSGFAVIDNIQLDGKAVIRMGTGVAD